MNASRPSWQSLWPLFAGPVAWTAHFLVSYVGAAVYCAKLGQAADVWPLRVGLGVATVIALAFIGLAAHHGFHQWRVERDTVQDQPTATDRRQLLGQAAILLCGLSAVATLYQTLPAVFFRSCQ